MTTTKGIPNSMPLLVLLLKEDDTMAKLILIDTVQLPTWAMCYVYNGDSEGLSDVEISMVDRWLAGYESPVTVAAVDADPEPSFTPYPEFGLACDCEDTNVWGTA